MHVLVVGVEHELQDPNPTGFPRDVPASETADKRRFAELLVKLASDRRVSLIAEEQLPPRATIPRQVATKLGIRHEYVEMSVADRRARNIPDNYSEDQSLSHDQVQAYHREREAYWVDRIETLAPSDTQCILVCGRDHMDGVATLLESGGHGTERIDIRAIDGFDLGWVKNARTA